MAIETPQEPAAALAGLDQLELAPPQHAKRHIGAKIWAAAWPKLLALVLALAIWQVIYLTGFKSAILPGPATTLTDLWHQLHTAQLWSALGTTLRRAIIGFAIALVIGTVVGALVSRIRPLRAAVGSLITAARSGLILDTRAPTTVPITRAIANPMPRGARWCRAIMGFAIALVIGTVVGALVSRIRPLRAAVDGSQPQPAAA